MKLLVAFTLIFAAPREAQPCSSEPLRGIDFTVLPADGSDAPANTLVWIANPDAANDFALVQRGTIVPTTMRAIRVGGEIETTLVVLAPLASLAANEVATVTRGGQPVLRSSRPRRTRLLFATSTSCPNTMVATPAPNHRRSQFRVTTMRQCSWLSAMV